MFQSDYFLRISPHLAVALLLIFFIPLVILTAVCRLIEERVLRRKPKSIQGDVAVVTGAGHGLGRCIAEELAKRGCHVAIVDINLEGAKETERILTSKFEAKCQAYKADVTNYDEILRLNESISKDLGVATILFNNAGIISVSNFASPSVEEIQRMINVNLTSHFLMNRVFLENMKRQRQGHIVAIGSITGIFPLIYNSLYCATKAGVRGMMRSLRLDLNANDFGDIRTTLAMPYFLSTNDRVTDFAHETNVEYFYPLIAGEDAAREIVQAMLKNEIEIILPNTFGIFSFLFDLLPAICQDKVYLMIAKPIMGRFQKTYEQHLKHIDL